MTEEKNGRTYRDYDEETIRILLAVAVLRRGDFTIEQIGIMQKEPREIPRVFGEYRETLRENKERLCAIETVLSFVEAEKINTIHDLAQRLNEAMTPNEPAQPDSPLLSRVPYRPAVWDEDYTKEEKEAAYRRFMKKQDRREKVGNMLLALPRKIGGSLGKISARVAARTRNTEGKLKGSARAILALVLVIGILGACLAAEVHKNQSLKNDCTHRISAVMDETILALRHILAKEEYTYGQSEQVCRWLWELGSAASTADRLHFHALNRNFDGSVGTGGIVDAMGCVFSAEINGSHGEGILRDGELSHNELRFIEMLYEDLTEVYVLTRAEDGINKRSDLRYEHFREELHIFLEKWGRWDVDPVSPYSLLTGE